MIRLRASRSILNSPQQSTSSVVKMDCADCDCRMVARPDEDRYAESVLYLYISAAAVDS